MVRRIYCLSIVWLLLMSYSITVADDGVSIEVQPATGSIYDTFVMIVDVDWEFSSGKIDLKPSPNFEVVGKGRNVNVDLSGGKISQNIQHKFLLKPLREGVLETPTVRIWPRRGSFREIQGKSVRVKQGPVANDPLTSNLRFTQSVDTLDVFQGQQLLNTIELERAINLDNLVIDTPQYSNAWVESLEQNNVRTRHDRDGNRIIVHTLSNVLYPTKTGPLYLPRRSMQAMAVLPNQRTANNYGHGQSISPFGRGGTFGGIDFFGSRYRRQPVQMNTNDLEVTVHPLPPAPADFSSWESSIPIVGNTTIELSYDSRPVNVGESRTLIYKIRSEGNIAPLKTVPLPELDGVKIYEESPERKTHHDGGKMIMTSTIPVTLVPISTQSIEIPPLSLGFFDPETKTYKKVTTEAVGISVLGTAASTPSRVNPVPATPADEDPSVVDTVSTPEPPVPDNPGLPQYEEATWLEDLLARYSFTFFLYWVLVILLITALGALTFWYSRKTSRKRSLRHRLRRAQEPEELRSVYLDCVGYNLGSVPNDADALKQSLEKTTLSTDVKFELLTLYDELSFLCYSGADTDSERLLGVRERLETITHRL